MFSIAGEYLKECVKLVGFQGIYDTETSIAWDRVRGNAIEQIAERLNFIKGMSPGIRLRTDDTKLWLCT